MGKAKFKFQRIKKLKIAIFEELQIVIIFELFKMSFEMTFILHGYHVYKDTWEVGIAYFT